MKISETFYEYFISSMIYKQKSYICHTKEGGLATISLIKLLTYAKVTQHFYQF